MYGQQKFKNEGDSKSLLNLLQNPRQMQAT